MTEHNTESQGHTVSDGGTDSQRADDKSDDAQQSDSSDAGEPSGQTNSRSTQRRSTPDDALGQLEQLVPGLKFTYLFKFAVSLLLIVIIISLVGFWVQADATSTLESDTENQLIEEVEADAQQLAQILTANERPVLLASDHPELGLGVNDTQRQQYIEQVAAEQFQEQGVVAIHVADPTAGSSSEAEIVASTASGMVGTTASSTDHPWVARTQSIDKNDAISTQPYPNANGDTVVTSMSLTTDLKHVFVVEYASDDLNERFSASIDGTFTEIVRPTAEGTEILLSDHPDGDHEFQPYIEGTSQDDIPEISEATANGTFTNSPTKEFEQGYVAAYATVAGSDWIAIKHAPSDNAFALSQDIQRGILVFIGVALLGVIAVGGTIGRNTAGAVKELSHKAKAIEDGNYDVEVENTRRDEIGELYSSIASMRNALVERLDEATEAREQANEAREEAEDARARAEVTKEEAQALATQLEEKAETYSDVMGACADGDLSRRMPEDADNDAMADIAVSFNEMLEQWEHTIVEIQEVANEVAEQSAHADDSIDDIERTGENVSNSIQNITEAAETQRENVSNVSDEMSQLSATIQEVTATAETVAQNAGKTADAGEQGQQAAENALAELDAIQTQADVAVEAIEDLDEGMAQINEIVEFITEIADQTNMLALNANIEAARAGEAGEGFAVVANEVKALAEETQDAAADIADIIADVQGTTETAVADIHEMSERVDDGSETVTQALDSLDQIAQMASETDDGVQEIKTATDTQASTAQEVSRMSDEVANVAEQTADETRNVAAAAEEQSASINSVSQNVEQLSAQARELREALAQFSVETRSELDSPRSQQ